MKHRLFPFLLAAALWPAAAHSFCGFYVARGDAALFNRASQVVLVRDGDRTVLTMVNDFRGEPKEFALVVPVPTVLQRGQIHVGDKAVVDRLDAYSAPRLVEYFDPDPCPQPAMDRLEQEVALKSTMENRRAQSPKIAESVTIEARYTVGEYDILILSAKESDGLAAWLTANGYRIPAGAGRVLDAYLKQGLKFFVAKVNLKEQAKLGFTSLRPIQIAYESPRFMLPVRLGMANAQGPQELFVYALTRRGRVESVNYRTVKLPSDMDLPPYIKGEFGPFYTALFDRLVERDAMRNVYTEYAWDVGWCDPCAGTPPSEADLRALGVWWLDEGGGERPFLTRLHARYDRAHFPEDLVFQETADRTNFQGRYILRHEWKGTGSCPEAERYRGELPARRAREARALAELTGWSLDRIRGQMGVGVDWTIPGESLAWWQRLWRN